MLANVSIVGKIFIKIVAEPLRIKGSDGKTYLNPKANRDFLATFLDRLGQLIDGGTYGPDYNYMGKPVTRFSTEGLAEIPVVETEPETSADASPVITPQRFDNTLAGQYQRYYKTPEFDGVFGAGARGTGAPQDAAAMEVLGNQLMAPEKDTNIASMYAAQSAMGRVNQDAIQKMYEGNEAMQAWAKANPMLAQREYLKAEAKRAENAPMAPDGETVMGDLGSRAQMENPMGQEAYDAIMAAKEKLMKKAGSK